MTNLSREERTFACSPLSTRTEYQFYPVPRSLCALSLYDINSHLSGTFPIRRRRCQLIYQFHCIRIPRVPRALLAHVWDFQARRTLVDFHIATELILPPSITFKYLRDFLKFRLRGTPCSLFIVCALPLGRLISAGGPPFRRLRNIRGWPGLILHPWRHDCLAALESQLLDNQLRVARVGFPVYAQLLPRHHPIQEPQLTRFSGLRIRA